MKPPDDEREVPVDVGTAVQLWWGIIVFGLIDVAATLIQLYWQRAELAEEFTDTLTTEQPDTTVTLSNPEALVVAGLGVAAVFALLVAGLFVFFVRKMERGRNWARMLLTIFGVIQAIGAITSLFGLASPDGTMALVTGASGIVQGVLAVGAIVLLHRRESNLYFLRFPPPG